jgi:hypothetical protein
VLPERFTGTMPSSLNAQLAVIADHLVRYQSEVADLADGADLDPDSDVAAALHEAERSLRTAARAVGHARSLSR